MAVHNRPTPEADGPDATHSTHATATASDEKSVWWEIEYGIPALDQ